LAPSNLTGNSTAESEASTLSTFVVDGSLATAAGFDVGVALLEPPKSGLKAARSCRDHQLDMGINETDIAKTWMLIHICQCNDAHFFNCSLRPSQSCRKTETASCESWFVCS